MSDRLGAWVFRRWGWLGAAATTALFGCSTSVSVEPTGESRAAATGTLSLYSTGVDNAGATLNGGDNELHYSITATTDPNHAAPRTPIVVSSNQLSGGWVGNTGAVRWISVLS